MRSEARHSPEAEHTVWWLLLCRAVERAARAAALREAAEVCDELSNDFGDQAADPDCELDEEAFNEGKSFGAGACADALRARAESEAGHG